MAEDHFWHQYKNRYRTLSPLVNEPVDPQTCFAVCIPAFAEPSLINTLQSLHDCVFESEFAEVIILFNSNDRVFESVKALHQQSIIEAKNWIASNYHAHIKWIPVVLDEMPDPKGGVGWARKLAMDEAALRLSPEGIIIALDADCTVRPDYISAIRKEFEHHPKMEAASIYFEHDYESLSKTEREAIINYELHLRYLVNAHRWCSHPHAYYTVGSSMAVRRNAYLAQGGMNTRRAGEDFYFLHKYTATNKLFEINTTTVYPSARISERVPFGTGKAMQQILELQRLWLTSNFETFRLIRKLFELIVEIHNLTKDETAIKKCIRHLHPGVLDFLDTVNFYNEVHQIAQHTNSSDAFRKRFFRYFNAFQMIRYTHYMRDHYFGDVRVEAAVSDLLTEAEIAHQSGSAEELLLLLRDLDKKNTI